MKKIALIAAREFIASVTNRGFVIGLLLMPAFFVIIFAVGPRLLNQSGPPVRGQISVLDPTGRIVEPLKAALVPEAIAARRGEAARAALQRLPQEVNDSAQSNAALDRVLGQIPEIRVADRPGAPDLESEKAWLNESSAGDRRLGIVVVHPDAVDPAGGRTEYGTYDLYLPATVDQRVEGTIRDAMRNAIIDARVRAGRLDRGRIDAIMRVAPPRSLSVTKTGATRPSQQGFNTALPLVFVALLVMGVMIGGQTLLTSTVEEKSSRVVEVLLSAVSPFELMAGKLLGQLAVSLLVLFVYVGLGLIVLVSMALVGLLDPLLLVYLVVFFVITYLVFASVMMAIGAAVNEMREAQSLLGPVMIVLMLPWLLAFPIARDPNTPMAIALSFVPPVNTFVMMLRLTSSSPPPIWQPAVTLLVGIATALGALWFAGKIFKIALLLHGKPPNLATLIRWARAA